MGDLLFQYRLGKKMTEKKFPIKMFRPVDFITIYQGRIEKGFPDYGGDVEIIEWNYKPRDNCAKKYQHLT
jgi:hypothetical protein